MKFVATILNPDATNFLNFIDLNFPEVKLERQKFSFGFYFTFENISLEDGKAVFELWIDSYE